MLVIFDLIVMFCLTFFAGYPFVSAFKNLKGSKINESIFYLTPVLGYAVLNILFLLFYTYLNNVHLSAYLTIAIVLASDLIYIPFELKKNGYRSSLIYSMFLNFDRRLLWIFLALFVLITWQYILIGQGHYYHSGNEDYFDSINGGYLFLINTPINQIYFDFSSHIKYHAIIKFQYSSQAMWRIFLSLNGMDGVMMQFILNLLFTAMGIYWLSHFVFKFSRNASLISAFWGITVSFYFVTYMTGHVGSMMYVSVVPFILGLFLLWSRKEIKWYWLILVGILYYFINNTYPGPVYFLAIPAFLIFINDRLMLPYKLWDKFLGIFSVSFPDGGQIDLSKVRKIRSSLFLVVVGLLVAFVVIWLWNFTHPWRMSALLRTNVSWKITLYKEMFMIFWGIYPPGSTGTSSILPLFVSNESVNIAALAFAIGISILTIIAIFKSTFTKQRSFLFVYGILFIPYLVIMRYFWGSPYYLYKFLYVHLFLIIMILIIWISEKLVNWKSRRKAFILGIFILLVCSNLVWDLMLGYDFYMRPYHRIGEIENFFNNVPKKLLDDTYIDIPNEVDNLVFSNIAEERGAIPKAHYNYAKYRLKLTQLDNAVNSSISFSKVVYQNNLLRLEEIPKENIVRLSTVYEPYHLGNVNINWIGNEFSVQKNLLQEDIGQLISFIKNKNIAPNCYLDMQYYPAYYLVYDAMTSGGMPPQIYPQKAKYFIRTYDASNKTNIYDDASDQKLIWKNDLFSVVYIPMNERKLGNYEYWRFNFAPVFEDLKKRGSEVYIDIPEYEYYSLFFKTFLPKLGIRVAETPDSTDLFIRLDLFKSFSKFKLTTVTSPNEKILWAPERDGNPARANWAVELVQVPFNDRVVSSEVLPKRPVKFLISNPNFDFTLYLSKLNGDAKYLRLYLKPGPSLEMNEFNLRVSNAEGVKKVYHIPGYSNVVDIKLEDFLDKSNGSSMYLYFEGLDKNYKNLIGHSLMPIEERYLNYSLLGADLTSQTDDYSAFMINSLNHPVIKARSIWEKLFGNAEYIEILDNNSKKLRLGSGWYDLEEFDNQIFRWAGSNPAELVFGNISGKSETVNLDLEPGPGCAGKPLELEVLLNDKSIMKESFSGRDTLKIDLSQISPSDIHEQNIIKLVPHTDNARIPSDSRILNFRVFSIGLNGKK